MAAAVRAMLRAMHAMRSRAMPGRLSWRDRRGRGLWRSLGGRRRHVRRRRGGRLGRRRRGGGRMGGNRSWRAAAQQGRVMQQGGPRIGRRQRRRLLGQQRHKTGSHPQAPGMRPPRLAGQRGSAAQPHHEHHDEQRAADAEHRAQAPVHGAQAHGLGAARDHPGHEASRENRQHVNQREACGQPHARQGVLHGQPGRHIGCEGAGQKKAAHPAAQRNGLDQKTAHEPRQQRHQQHCQGHPVQGSWKDFGRHVVHAP